ncbi:MAG: GNAT family N-acetyltransferase, partial [Rhodospirillaceae bacterium]|nr:GNAT family N-acetyltransferase [Rhodospirillaceae bacterium]
DRAETLPLRPVRPEDATMLFEWANLPEVLAVSIRRRKAVQWDEHCAWLAERLADPQSAFWMLEQDGRAAGYLRLQGREEGSGEEGPEVSIYVGPAARRRGLGMAMLAHARQEQMARWPARALIARVRPDNLAARTVFEAAGYRIEESLPDHLLFRDHEAAMPVDETTCGDRLPVGATHPGPVIYADSCDALALAWPKELPTGAVVRSNAPALIADPAIRAMRADDRLTPQHIHALVDALDAAAAEVRDEISTSHLTGAAEAAISVYSAIVGELQNHVCTAAMLREEDMDGNAQVVAVAYEDANLRRRFRFALADVLAECGVEATEVDGHRLAPVDEPTPPHPNLWTRLAHSTLESLVYRVGRSVQRRMPLLGRRGTIAIYRENELLKETAAHLLLRGYAIRAINIERRDDGRKAQTIDIGPTIEAALHRQLGAVMPDRVAAALGRIGRRLAVERLRSFAVARGAWRARLKPAADRPKAVLSNRLHSAEYWAMYSALLEAGIPLIAFQHGVTPEFAMDRVNRTHGHENTGADLSIVFNPEMERILRENPDARGPALAVGMPKDYRRLYRRRAARTTAPVWYIRTSLYQSNLGRMHRGIADPAMYERERLLVEQVFSRVPHRVAYKPYPAIRYLDPDPIDTLVSATPNMRLYDGRLDLRYVVAGARVLVTAAATSTLSWCLMADRPLIFLDSPDFAPLRPAVRRHLEKAAFVFDLGESNAVERLRAFLSRPLDAIEADWREKAASRAAFIAQYVDSGQPSPGIRAANAVETLLQQQIKGGSA